jgi:hypothetical protein
LRRVISLLCAVALLGAGNGSVDAVDAFARAAGNDKPVAVQIGKVLFSTEWSAQILKVYVNGFGGHKVAGVMLSGVKFHKPLTRDAFVGEVSEIVARAFTAAPVEEVDLWCVVPLSVGKGIVVTGDNAKPTQRTVFTVTVRRGETAAAVRNRIDAGKTVYWDSLWARQALRPHPPKQGT